MSTVETLMVEVRDIDAHLADALANAAGKGSALEMKLRSFMAIGDRLDAMLSLIPDTDPKRRRIETFFRLVIGLVDSTLDELRNLDERAMWATAKVRSLHQEQL